MVFRPGKGFQGFPPGGGKVEQFVSMPWFVGGGRFGVPGMDKKNGGVVLPQLVRFCQGAIPS